MDNYIQKGDNVTVAAPYDVSSGDGAQVGALFGVAVAAAASGADVVLATTGVYLMKKAASQAWTLGQKIYWDNSDKECTSDSTAGMLIGVATVAATSSTTGVTGYVRLNGAAPGSSEGPQAAIADIDTADATDATTAAALANANKAKINALLATLRVYGVIAAS